METALPPGDYAIVEMFGHTKLIGRMSETERFGQKLLALEPIYQGELMPAMMIGGAAIYCLTPCTPAVALVQSPKSEWGLPESLRATLPPRMLAAPEMYEEPPAFAPAFLDRDDPIEERAVEMDNLSYMQPPQMSHPDHPKGCDCIDCTMPF